jgi:hypothetical protein
MFNLSNLSTYLSRLAVHHRPIARRHLVSAGCALSVSQELLLHNLPELQVLGATLCQIPKGLLSITRGSSDLLNDQY